VSRLSALGLLGELDRVAEEAAEHDPERALRVGLRLAHAGLAALPEGELDEELLGPTLPLLLELQARLLGRAAE
jgi:hypothetical protein